MSDAQRWADALADATNTHDIEALVACFAEDYVNETPAHPRRGFIGREQVRRNWTSMFAAVPDVTSRVVNQAIDGSTLWLELEASGTRLDGGTHLLRGVVIFELADGRAQRARFYLEPVEEASGDVDDAIDRVTGTARS